MIKDIYLIFPPFWRSDFIVAKCRVWAVKKSSRSGILDNPVCCLPALSPLKSRLCVRREVIDPSAENLSFLKHKMAHEFQSKVAVRY